jgi:hypothetical protein
VQAPFRKAAGPDDLASGVNPRVDSMVSRDTDSIYRCAQHVRLWLAAAGSSYNHGSREAFARAHPALFGRAYHVTLHGYDKWRTRHGVTDTVEGFARYVARRHERWLAGYGLDATIAPCLLGTKTSQPCWKADHVSSGLDVELPAAA